jgi:hypothetical protein
MKPKLSTLQNICAIFGLVAGLTVAAFFSPSQASTTVEDVTVYGTMNIYGSGHLTAPGPCGNGGGILPFEISIPDGTNRSVHFNLSGTVDFGPCCPTHGPDGSVATSAIPQPQYNGLAGCDIPTRVQYLVAVFLDDFEPMDPPPDSLVIADEAFTELSPELRQIFFIGDGLTGEGSGETQTFHIPDDATRLFLGYADRCSSSQPDSPGYYSDNSGTVTGTATFDIGTGVGTHAPASFQLAENFPNPFSSATTVTFSAELPGIFDLSIYDVQGRLVRTLLHERVEGTRNISWDGRDNDGNLMPSGIYYYRLKSGAFSSTRKMLLLR